jgi:iron complex outermembrane recepter protein
MKSILPIIISFFSLTASAQQKDSLPKTDTSSFNQTKKMDEVLVKSKKPFIEMQVDKLVLNIQNDIVATGGTVFEILQRAPGVTISNDETVNLAGKAGVNVLIDGRPTQLGGKDLANYLKATPGSVVDKVEIIMNPSAKYDAQGNAGIINIKLKKNTVKGTNGNLSTSYTQSNHPNYNFSANLNHRKGKWNWFVNATARRSRQNTIGAINRFVNSNSIAKTFANSTVDQDASKNISLKAGADFFLNTKSTFGFMIKGNEYWSRLYTPGTTLIQTNNTTDSSLQTMNDNKERTSRYNYNFNYRYEDTLGNELNIDADYSSFKNNKNGLVTTDLLNAQSMKYGYTANDQDAQTDINIYSIKTDFSKQFKKSNAKMEAGLKWNTVQTANDLQAYVWSINKFTADTGRTNIFNYTETMFAAYASYTQKIKKWEYQFGLRAEQSVINGTSTDLKSKQINYPDTSYFNIFPTAFVRYTMNENNSFGISYGRRINRPTYQDLNPFEYIYDNYTRERGNPYLLPEYSNNFELSYSYKSALNLGLGYSITNNSFQSISTQKGEITEESDYNLGKEKRIYLSLNLSMPVTKWWDGYVNLNPFYKSYKGAIAQGRLDNTTWGMSWYCSNNFSLPKKWKLQLSSWGNIRTLDGIYKTSGLGSVDAGVSKAVLKDKLTIRVSATDIFNTQRWRQQVNFGDVNFNYQRKWESRTIRVQLNWKFGKTSYKARERELGAQDQLDRIK